MKKVMDEIVKRLSSLPFIFLLSLPVLRNLNPYVNRLSKRKQTITKPRLPSVHSLPRGFIQSHGIKYHLCADPPVFTCMPDPSPEFQTCI